MADESNDPLRGLRVLAALQTQKLRAYTPHPKQALFHELGGKYRQRAALAANQSGKSTMAGAEVAIHATGRYPDWWTGHRFAGPTRGWYANTNWETVRDNGQRLLLGAAGPETYGTGMIPKDAILEVSPARGIANLADVILIRHVSGGVSYLKSKCYDPGHSNARLKWQGETLDYIWYDEEPPADIYSEGWIRLGAKRGLAFITATPLQGITDVIQMFWPEPNQPDRVLVQMGILDALHFSEIERMEHERGIPEHEKESRLEGVPLLGSGLIFPVSEDTFLEEPFEIPRDWRQIGGIDFGWAHPTAAAKLVMEPDGSRVHVTRDWRQKESTQGIVALALKPWGDEMPWAWPHDGNRVEDKQSDIPLAEVYRRHGLRMLPTHATYRTGGYGVDAALQEMLEWLQSGRFKVFSNCSLWREERRTYYRRINPTTRRSEIVKEREDVISASRYAFMMRRHARSPLMDAGSHDLQVEGLGRDWNPYTRRVSHGQ